jgi:hypothetical protein
MILHADYLTLVNDPAFFKGVASIIVDPPYAPYVHSAMISNHSEGQGPTARDVGFDACTDELRRAIAIAAARVARWTVIFSDLESTHLWKDEVERLGVEYVREVQWPDGVRDPIPARWIRWSQPQNSGDRPPTGAEATMVFHAMTGGNHPRSVRKHWNGPGNLTHWPQKCLRGDDKYGAEKPLDLMLAMVSAFSDPGETVLDMCAGVGTTHRACDLLGRECIAVEAIAEVAVEAQRRCAAPLTEREIERAERFCEWSYDFANGVPHKPPKTPGHAAWQRAQRQLADVARVAGALP